MQANTLKEKLRTLPQEDYPVHSRIHRLSLGRDVEIPCFAKREDELGGIFAGSKMRKYRTMIPHIKKSGCKEVALIGSSHSNQILGLSQLLIECGITPILYLLESSESKPTGNALFSRLFVPKEQIHYIKRKDWCDVEMLARKAHACVVPEGGDYTVCLGGLITLALDILQNEAEHNITFSDIFIDSGSHLTATSLIVTLAYLKRVPHVHVMLAAYEEKAFHNKLEQAKTALAAFVGHSIDALPPFTLYPAPSGQSFGSTNRTIFQTIERIAKSEGMLLDPIYSAKLYLLLEEKIASKTIQGPVLFIHSGGQFSLSGFQDRLHTG